MNALRNSVRTTPLAACTTLALLLGQNPIPGYAATEAARYGAGGSRRADALRAAIGERSVSLWSTAPDSGPRPQVPVLPVTSCDDDGSAGTLRSVVAGAGSGSIIDLSALTCSTISLANGAIAVAVESLRFVGPGSTQLSLDANQSYRRILEHSGHGLLTVSGLRFSGGWAGIVSPAYGGCIYSAGSVSLYDTAVVYCKAVSNTGPAKGGGIYAAGDLTLHHSIVSGNGSNPGTDGFGGGAFAAGDLGVYYSTIADNFSVNLAYGGGFGGGLFALGSVNIFASTIANNHAVNVGGISIAGFAADAVIVNSTVSGNVASNFIGGVYSNTPLQVYNSTIAFNDAANQSSVYVTAGGLQIYATSADLESSIIANNTAASFSFDVGMQDGSITGANNLIRTASNLMPPDTITDDPQLLSLADNGGETATLAIAGSSPAIDHGNDLVALDDDQRGPGYVRAFGAGPDIGAFEFQPVGGEIIFRDGFDGGM